jgi:hypothetical protein
MGYNSKKAIDKVLLMCAATYNFAIYSEHLPGKLNFLADSLSRFQIEKFRQLAPDSEATATPCPEYLRCF